MSSTITLQRTADFIRGHVSGTPVQFSSNSAGDPLFMMADRVRQFILAPPFAWRWNRAQTSSPLTQGQQDITLSVPDFGWLEKGIYTDSTAATWELEVQDSLSQEVQQNQPRYISTLLDDDNSNLTFRISPPPNDSGTVNIIYQKATPVFSSVAETWAPIPDWLYYLCTQGMLAEVYEYKNDPRMVAALQIFVKQVIAANAGLSDTQISLFMGELMYAPRTQAKELQTSQMGRQGRGLF